VAHIPITRKHGAEIIQTVAIRHLIRQTSDDILGEFYALCFGHSREDLLRFDDFCLTVLGVDIVPAENEEVESGNFFLVKAQCIGTVRESEVEIGAGPVDDRHEVATYGYDFAPRQIFYRCDPAIYVRLMTRPRELNVLMNRYTFHHAPL